MSLRASDIPALLANLRRRQKRLRDRTRRLRARLDQISARVWAV